MTGMLWGCATLNDRPDPPPGPVPVFEADETDRVIVQSVQRDQETLMNTCAQHQSCDQVHFTRAMIALFQNGDAAATSFKQSIAAAPKGPLADSSTRWLRFLTNRTVHSVSAAESNGALAVMKGLVRTWLEHQWVTSASGPLQAVDSAKSPKQAVHILQQKIRDRDKQIAELTDQLSALKQIDLEVHKPNKLSLQRTPSK